MKRIGAFILILAVVILGSYFLYQNWLIKKNFTEICDVQRIRLDNRTTNYKVVPAFAIKESKLPIQRFQAGGQALAFPAGAYTKTKQNSETYCEFQRQMPAPGFLTMSFQILHVSRPESVNLNQFEIVKNILLAKDSFTCEKSAAQEKFVQDIANFEEQLPTTPNTSVVVEEGALVYMATQETGKGLRYLAEVKFPVDEGKKIATYKVESSSEDLRNSVLLGLKSQNAVTPSLIQACIQLVLEKSK